MFKSVLKEFAQNNKTGFVYITDIAKKYPNSKLGNGGSWCRYDTNPVKDYKVATVKMRKNKSLIIRHTIENAKDDDVVERVKIDKLIIDKLKDYDGKCGCIIGLVVYGKRNLSLFNRPIRADIRKELSVKPCVVCGTTTGIEIDHKNGLYNDNRVLVTKTQVVNDFQPLCRHCNQVKRQSIVNTKKQGKRVPACIIPSIKHLGIDYTTGDEKYDPSDPNAMVGTYWYDPVDFVKKSLKLNKMKTVDAISDITNKMKECNIR